MRVYSKDERSLCGIQVQIKDPLLKKSKSFTVHNATLYDVYWKLLEAAEKNNEMIIRRNKNDKKKID